VVSGEVLICRSDLQGKLLAMRRGHELHGDRATVGREAGGQHQPAQRHRVVVAGAITVYCVQCCGLGEK
jgi:hypothetical protein